MTIFRRRKGSAIWHALAAGCKYAPVKPWKGTESTDERPAEENICILCKRIERGENISPNPHRKRK